MLIDGKYHGANVQSALARHRLEESKKGGKSKGKETVKSHLDQAQKHLSAAQALHGQQEPAESEQEGQEEGAMSTLGLSQNEQN